MVCTWCVPLESYCVQNKGVSLKQWRQGIVTSTSNHYRWHQALVESLIFPSAGRRMHNQSHLQKSFMRKQIWALPSSPLLLIHERWCCKRTKGPRHTLQMHSSEQLRRGTHLQPCHRGASLEVSLPALRCRTLSLWTDALIRKTPHAAFVLDIWSIKDPQLIS